MKKVIVIAIVVLAAVMALGWLAEPDLPNRRKSYVTPRVIESRTDEQNTHPNRRI